MQAGQTQRKSERKRPHCYVERNKGRKDIVDVKAKLKWNKKKSKMEDLIRDMDKREKKQAIPMKFTKTVLAK